VDGNAYLNSFSIDLGMGQVSQRRIGDIAGDFCKFADSVAGMKHRYGYMSSFSSGEGTGADFDAITMYDLETGSESSRGFGLGTFVGECAFAPNVLGNGAEDDGWIVNYVYAKDGSESEFVAIDPHDFLAEPIVRSRLRGSGCRGECRLGFMGTGFRRRRSRSQTRRVLRVAITRAREKVVILRHHGARPLVDAG
jgi:carotenoid cleavage dioxygenase-like enzyme